MNIGSSINALNPAQKQLHFGHPVLFQTNQKNEISMLQKIEMMTNNRQRLEDPAKLLSKEQLLALDQEAFSAKIAKSTTELLEKTGFTETFLDQIGEALDHMDTSASSFNNALLDFANTLYEFDTSIKNIEDALNGQRELGDLETQASLEQQLKELMAQRETHLSDGGQRLFELGKKAELKIHQSMNALNQFQDIWDMLSSSDSESVKNAIDILSKEDYGFIFQEGEDVYSGIERITKNVSDVSDSIKVLKEAVNYYGKKLKSDKTEAEQEAEIQDKKNQLYLQQAYLEKNDKSMLDDMTHFKAHA